MLTRVMRGNIPLQRSRTATAECRYVHCSRVRRTQNYDTRLEYRCIPYIYTHNNIIIIQIRRTIDILLPGELDLNIGRISLYRYCCRRITDTHDVYKAILLLLSSPSSNIYYYYYYYTHYVCF